jgi:hypothetical protein
MDDMLAVIELQGKKAETLTGGDTKPGRARASKRAAVSQRAGKAVEGLFCKKNKGRTTERIASEDLDDSGSRAC